MGNKIILKKTHADNFVRWLRERNIQHKFACGNQWLMIRIKIGGITCWRRIYESRLTTHFTVDNDLVELVQEFKYDFLVQKKS